VFGTLATWSFLHGDPLASEGFATRGLEAAVDDDGLGFCTVATFYALASAGRIEECAQYVPQIRSLMEGTGPIGVRQVAAQALVDASLGSEAAAEAVDWYVRLSAQMGEIQLARSWLARGNLFVYGTDPPDLDGGMAAARTAIELAEEVGASEASTWARIILADALAMCADPGARDAVRAALSGSFDVRYGMAGRDVRPVPGIGGRHGRSVGVVGPRRRSAWALGRLAR
jgi:hypothetical protein